MGPSTGLTALLIFSPLIHPQTICGALVVKRRRRGVCYCMALPDVKEREVRDGVLCFRRVAERGMEPKIRILPSGGRGAGPHISAFAKMRMKLPAAIVHMVL